jgi:CopG family nickel-responsive transcriptional regulator
MPVISISLPEPLLRQLDQAISREGFSGRSEALRAAVRAWLQRSRERPASGRISAVLSLAYPEGAEGEISSLLHRSSGLIESMVHTHTPGRHCVTVLVLSGDAARLRELAGALGGRRDVETVEFQPLGP